MRLFNHSRIHFLLMFVVIFLLSFNFTILRSVRNTLAVVDLGNGSHMIPFFELFGALPAAILTTWALTKLMNRFSLRSVFLITLMGFLTFFLLFACLIYPFFIEWQKKALESATCSPSLVQGCGIAFSMLFYCLAELWKPALINILFWGLLNNHVTIGDAKNLYAFLLLGASFGALCAGPILKICNSEASWTMLHFSSRQWTHAFILITFVLLFVGLIIGLLYDRLYFQFSQEQKKSNPASIQPSFSLQESFQLCMTSKPLFLLSGIVIADYIAYSLGEVIFLDILKKRYSSPCDYCTFLGTLSSWGSALTIVFALIAPMILQKYRWVVAALALPLFLFVVEGLFFFFLRAEHMTFTFFGWSHPRWLHAVILLGSLHYCVCRALKYTLFDASKELAFVFLPQEQKVKGKLIVDGICARLGRGSSSGISLLLIQICGGVLASSLISGVIVIGIACGWIWATKKLGLKLENVPEKVAHSRFLP
jgi:ATP:ADP antiporter, AAA family